MESSTKRGAKPRNRYYFCAAIINSMITHEIVHAESEDEAKASFKESYDVDATICDSGVSLGGGNGFYLVKGTGISPAQRISVTVTAEQLMRRTANSFKAEFKGWNVFCSGLQACSIQGTEYNDNELVAIELDSRVDKDSKIPKLKLKKREVVRRSDLENVQTCE